jgi:hypothetical protein
MKVSDLQQYFTDLARLLNATDDKKSAGKISGIAQLLQPFQDYDLGDFANFLMRAEEFNRTGLIPITPSKPTSRAKASAQPKPELAALRSEVLHLHGSASSPGVDMQSIEALGPKLGALGKADLVAVAEAIGLVGMKSKTIPQISTAIVSRIRSIKQSSIRTAISDRPGNMH